MYPVFPKLYPIFKMNIKRHGIFHYPASKGIAKHPTTTNKKSMP